MAESQFALLMHRYEWASNKSKMICPGGVTLYRTAGSRVEKLYFHLCETEGIDDGDPFSYKVHFVIDQSKHKYGLAWPEWSGSHSFVSQFSNFIVICLSALPGGCRAILSQDKFKTKWFTEDIYDFTYPSESFDCSEGWAKLTDSVLYNVKACWTNYLPLVNQRGFYSSRVKRALDFFFYSWRAFYIEHTCLNLAIAFETLFSPFTETEISHQIAYNVCRFYGVNAEQREEIYHLMKKFYKYRSIIVHGGETDNPNNERLTVRVFKIFCSIMERILLNRNLLNKMNDNTERKKLFNNFLFA